MDPDEASYLVRTILSFKYYQRATFAMNHVRMQQFYALPEAHRNLLQPSFTEKLEAIDEAIEKNAVIARLIARVGEEMLLFGMEVRMGGPITPRQKYRLVSINCRDMDKARSTLKQFVRDWSVEVIRLR
jgi:carnosine N-methyltransferase